MDLKTNLSLIMKKKGLSLTKLAKLSAVPLSTLHSWTTGKKTLNLEQLKRVALVLECPLHELAFGCPDPFDGGADESLKELFAGDVRVVIHKILRKRRSVTKGGGAK